MYTKEQQKEYRQAHRAEHRLHSQTYREKHPEEVKKSQKTTRSRPLYKAKQKEYQKNYQKLYREKNYVPHPRLRNYKISEKEYAKKLVRGAVRIALDNGSLKRQSCTKCGIAKAEAHHPDYSKPLEVLWLCRKHHVEHHKSIGSYTKKATPLLSSSYSKIIG